MFRERSLKPLARRRRIDERIEEDGAVSVGQNERLMLRDRPPGGVCERRHAEIRQLASLKLRRPLNEGLGRLVDAKPESLFPKPPVVLCCRGHDISNQNVRQMDELFKPNSLVGGLRDQPLIVDRSGKKPRNFHHGNEEPSSRHP